MQGVVLATILDQEITVRQTPFLHEFREDADLSVFEFHAERRVFYEFRCIVHGAYYPLR